MNKKGQGIGFEMIVWIPRIVFLVFVITSIWWFSHAFIKTQIDISRSESDLLFNRMVYTPAGASLEINGRVYPGSLDAAHFTDGRFQSRLQLNPEVHAAKFITVTRESAEEDVWYINKKSYEEWQPIAEFIAGGGSAIDGRHPYANRQYALVNGERGTFESVIIKNE